MNNFNPFESTLNHPHPKFGNDSYSKLYSNGSSNLTDQPHLTALKTSNANSLLIGNGKENIQSTSLLSPNDNNNNNNNNGFFLPFKFSTPCDFNTSTNTNLKLDNFHNWPYNYKLKQNKMPLFTNADLNLPSPFVPSLGSLLSNSTPTFLTNDLDNIHPDPQNGLVSSIPQSDNFTSRVIKLTNFPLKFDPIVLHNICSNIGDVESLERHKKNNMGQAIISWYDIRDSAKCHSNIGLLFQDVPGIVGEYVGTNNDNVPLLCDATLSKIEIHFKREFTSKLFPDIKVLISKLSEFGDIQNLSFKSSSKKSYVCDFFDTRSSAAAIKYLNGSIIDNLVAEVYPFGKRKLDSTTSFPTPENTFSPEVAYPVPSYKGVSYDSAKYSRSSTDTDLRLMGFSKINDAKLETSKSMTGVATLAHLPKRNTVDLTRISKGLDTRTTMMIRNIPNKVGQDVLQKYIDVTNKGTYDFLYLRIDFANRCNVGYAFISFIVPEHIITFVKARVGTKWRNFNSDKICDISYANI